MTYDLAPWKQGASACDWHDNQHRNEIMRLNHEDRQAMYASNRANNKAYHEARRIRNHAELSDTLRSIKRSLNARR